MLPRGLVGARSVLSSDAVEPHKAGATQSANGAALELRFFGDLSVRVDGVARSDRDFQRLDARRLLCALVLSRTQHLTRHELCQQLWPQQPAASARTKLTNALFSLRKALGHQAQYLYSNAETVAVRLDRNVFWDVALFEQHLDAAAVSHDSVEKCEELEQALALYRGDLLEPFLAERWLDQDRELLRTRYRWALDEIVSIYTAQPAQLDRAIAWQHRRIDSEPTLQAAHETLLRLLLTAGHYEQAREQYKRCRDIIATELGQSPSPEIQALYTQIKAHAPISSQPTQPQALKPSAQRTPAASLPSATQASASAETQPPPSGDFFGRERDIEVMLSLLQEHTEQPRIITITGFGGVGKTTLARQLMARWTRLSANDHSSREALFLDLRETTSLATAAEQIKQRLNLPVPLDADDRLMIEGDLHTQLRALLVIDNYEQLATHAHLLTTLVRRCPYLKVVVTSRVPLRIKEELVYPLATLPIKTDAVALFVQRARLRNPGLSFDNKELAVVASICNALDGLPLAIELAAARTRLFSPRELQQRLSRDLRLLHSKPSPTDSTRSEPHRSLWSILEWTINLLSPPERELMYWLRVFQGGFTYEAAEAVFAHHSDQVADLLEALIDHQLIVPMHETINTHPTASSHNSAHSDNAQPLHHRWTLLETIKQFLNARAQGEESLSHAKSAHGKHFLREAAAALDKGARQERAAQFIAEEMPNLFEALEQQYEEDPVRTVPILVRILKRITHGGSSYIDAHRWIERLSATDASVVPDVYKDELQVAMLMRLYNLFDWEKLRELADRHLQPFDSSGHVSGLILTAGAYKCFVLLAIEGNVGQALFLGARLLRAIEKRTDTLSHEDLEMLASQQLYMLSMVGRWSDYDYVREQFAWLEQLPSMQFQFQIEEGLRLHARSQSTEALALFSALAESRHANENQSDLLELRVLATKIAIDAQKFEVAHTYLEQIVSMTGFASENQKDIGLIVATFSCELRCSASPGDIALSEARKAIIHDGQMQTSTYAAPLLVSRLASAVRTLDVELVSAALAELLRAPRTSHYLGSIRLAELLGQAASLIGARELASQFFFYAEESRRPNDLRLSAADLAAHKVLDVPKSVSRKPLPIALTENWQSGREFWQMIHPDIVALHEIAISRCQSAR